MTAAAPLALRRDPPTGFDMAPIAEETNVLVVWTTAGTNGRAAFDDRKSSHLLLLVPGTTDGRLHASDPPASQRALAELRSMTRLTWTQLARALGVQRRSLHFWAQGETPSASNMERLMQFVRIVRTVDRGNRIETTRFLIEPQGERPSPFDLLCNGRVDDVLALLQQSAGWRDTRRGSRRPPPLSRRQRSRRRGIPPLERLDAMHDIAPLESGQLIASIPIANRLD